MGLEKLDTLKAYNEPDRNGETWRSAEFSYNGHELNVWENRPQYEISWVLDDTEEFVDVLTQIEPYHPFKMNIETYEKDGSRGSHSLTEGDSSLHNYDYSDCRRVSVESHDNLEMTWQKRMNEDREEFSKVTVNVHHSSEADEPYLRALQLFDLTKSIDGISASKIMSDAERFLEDGWQ